MDGQPSAELTKIVRTMRGSPAEAAAKLKMLTEQNPGHADTGLYYSMALRLQGKLDEAEAALNILIARFPAYASAWQELGITLFAAGQLPQAVRALEKAIKLNPNVPPSWTVYADIMSKLGREDVAQKARQQADKLQAAEPAAPQPGMNLEQARNFLRHGDTQQTEAICRNLLAHTPNDVEAMCLLASARLQTDGLIEAREILERCLEIAPDHHLARVTLASTLQRAFEHIEAKKHLNIVDAAAPNDPEILFLRCKIHVDYGQYTDAITGFEDLLRRFDRVPETLMEYGLALRAVGRRDEAAAAFREAERKEPGRGMPWYALANLKTGELDSEDIRLVEGYLDTPDKTREDNLLLSFALGMALEEKADWDGAFAAYNNGNTIQRQLRPFDAQTERARLSALRQHFGSRLVASHEGSGCRAPDPIFVLGLPRSGSTLIEQILASHSLVEGTDELTELNNITEQLWSYGEPGAPASYCDAVRNMSSDQLTAMGQDYIDRTQIRRAGNVFFVDKLLGNFLHVGLIKLILPNAKIIEVRKSPMAHCFSMWKQLFPSGVNFSHDLEELGAYYCDYTALMDHWHALFPGGILSVVYEDLVTDTEGEVRAILDHCGLDFEEPCLTPHRTRRVVLTSSSEQVRQPIHDGAVHHWRNFEHHLAPLKAALAPLSGRIDLD